MRIPWIWEGHSGRFVYALNNDVLLNEASGKGFVVYRNMLRRIGGRVRGAPVLTKARLRAMIEDEDAARAVVGSLQRQGRTVRSTPTQWKFEGKKLDAGVKHVSWLPPFVRPVGAVADEHAGLIPEHHQVDDTIGLGRIPTAWWTLNCKYSAAYDVHRLNVRDSGGRAAVDSYHDEFGQVRFDFLRKAPDLVATQLALRAELNHADRYARRSAHQAGRALPLHGSQRVGPQRQHAHPRLLRGLRWAEAPARAA